jgi:MFS family permease
VLSLVTGVGAAVSMVLNPLWGAFSDRTTSRRGRRLPWVIGGVAGGMIAMLLLSQAHSVLAMVAGWSLAQGSLNATLAAMTAIVPDQVPARQRGAVGGILAIAQTLGVIAGSGIAAATGSIAAGYLTLTSSRGRCCCWPSSTRCRPPSRGRSCSGSGSGSTARSTSR